MNLLHQLIAGLPSDLQNFHFLRPLWLLALPLAWLIAIVCSRRRRSGQGQWSKLIDPVLLAGLRLEQRDSSKPASPWPWLALIWTLAAVALAGPSWQQLTTTGYRAPAAWVVVLDLSPSMNASDVAPTRVIRARYAIDDLLNGAEDARVGLVVFSDEPYTVSPLTDDVGTVRALLGPLLPGLMPSAGDNLAPALEQAGQLLQKAGSRAQHVVVFTDGFDDPSSALAAARKLKAAGATIDVIGIGTTSGAPVAASGGGFSRDEHGRPQLTKLDSDRLQQLARAGGGRYADTAGLPSLINSLHATLSDAGEAVAGHDVKIEHWRDAGIWLLPVILLFAVPLARRQWL